MSYKYKDKWGKSLTLGDKIIGKDGWIFEIIKEGRRYIGKRIDCRCRNCQRVPWWCDSKYFDEYGKV